jgi:uncharacterized protein
VTGDELRYAIADNDNDNDNDDDNADIFQKMKGYGKTMTYKTLGNPLEEDQILLREGILKFPEGPDDKPQIVASRCIACGDVAFPEKLRCGKCDGKIMEEVLLSNRGTLYAHTIVRQAVPGYEVPNILGVVKVPEDDDLLIMAQIRECRPEEVSNGMAVETIVAQLYHDFLRNKKVIGYAFRPVKEK